MIGELVGNFRIVAALGRGGMSEVFRAEHTSVGTPVAIKLLEPELSADAGYVRRLFDEARAAGRIRHPGVVQIFDVGMAAGRAYLMMELLEGESLREVVRRERYAPTARIVNVGRQLASVLDAVHAAGITHRDLKPDNIFLLHDPQLPGAVRVKVLDFGIAKLTGTLRGASPPTTGAIGTPAYMAPEQWGDPVAIDGRADLYALGCVLFEMACGRPPFLVSTMAEACNQHLHGEPPRARSLAPGVPAALDDLLVRLLAKDPAVRPSARDVNVALEALELGTIATVATESAAQPAPIPAERARRRRAWAATILVLLAIGVASVVIATRTSTPRAASETGTPSVNADLVTWLAAQNPWFTYHGVPSLMYPVRRPDYARYLSSLPADRAHWATPLYDWSDPAPGVTSPVTWVTFEQAAAFCATIGGRLMTNDEWETAAAGAFGVGVSGVREWTATRTASGRVLVRGAFTEMQPDQIEAERPWRRELDTEASAGGRAPIAKVASGEIGFRCTR